MYVYNDNSNKIVLHFIYKALFKNSKMLYTENDIKAG